MLRGSTGLLLVALLAVSCGKPAADMPAAQEISSASVAEFCGMSLAEHPGPKAQLFVKGRHEPYWFASVHDMFAFLELPEAPREVAAVYVSDMGRARDWDHPEPGTWTDARKAVFVIESSARGGMGEPEAVPFGDPAAAQKFVQSHGGRVVMFGAMPRDYILPGTDEARQSSDAAQRRL